MLLPAPIPIYLTMNIHTCMSTWVWSLWRSLTTISPSLLPCQIAIFCKKLFPVRYFLFGFSVGANVTVCVCCYGECWERMFLEKTQLPWEVSQESLRFFVFVLSVPQFSSVQFSRSVMSDSLWPHESQHVRPPCPSLTPRVHSDSCPSSPWCHQAISSSVVPFSSSPQALPASESFPVSQFFAWGGQSTGDSALASFLPK